MDKRAIFAFEVRGSAVCTEILIYVNTDIRIEKPWLGRLR